MEYIETLERNEYAGYVTLEINDAIYLTDPHRALMETAHYLKQRLPAR